MGFVAQRILQIRTSRNTEEASLYKTSANYRSLSRSQGAIPASPLATVQIAKFPGEEATGVYGIRCGNCSSTGWQWCEKTLDGMSLDLPPFLRKCAPPQPVKCGTGVCPLGEECCCDKGCMPAGADCCSNCQFCPKGTTCVNTFGIIWCSPF
jgi:hypothetical protein